ncbi:hypothetical protein J6590_003908 [Homalodisca vitripennis]|nr:hypothetical protein J6590_003908 [Homalodisca vitripennis]
MTSAVILCLLPSVLSGHVDTIVVITFMLVIGYLNMVSWFWVVSTQYVSIAANHLKDSVLMAMENIASTQKLRSHRALWLELHSFSTALSEGMGDTMRAWETIMVFSFVLSLYNWAICIHSNQPILQSSSAFMTAVHSGLHTLLLHNTTHVADYKVQSRYCLLLHYRTIAITSNIFNSYDLYLQVGRGFALGILSCRFQKFSDEQLNEVELLLLAIETSSNRFLLKGMIDFKRPLLVTIMESTITILVVLIQFKVFV